MSALCMAMSVESKADEKTIGYCPSEITDNVYPVGVSYQEAYVGAAIKFTASTTQALKGNQITKIRIGVKETLKSPIYVWIREGSLTGTPVVMQSVSGVEQGWNEVALSTPYDITGEEIYVGYNGKQPYGEYCIYLDGDDNENATFIYDGSSWDDYYGQGWGSLLIQATVSGDNFASVDMAVQRIKFDNTYYKAGETAEASITLSNEGTSPCSGLAYYYQIDSQEPVRCTVSETIEGSAQLTLQHQISLEGIAEGEHTLTAYIDRESLAADEVAGNDTLAQTTLVYETDYKRTLLLEHFTTIGCINCPYGNNVLNYATKGRDDVAWVAHHAGYGTDELTVSASEEYLDFGVTGAPMAMIDRTYIPYLSAESNYPPFSIGYSSTSEGGELVKAFLDQQAAVPAFSTLGIKCSYDEATRRLTADVSGQCNGIFQKLAPQTALTVFLIENNVTAKTVQTGTTNEYTHHHVLRRVMSATYGDDIEWSGNAFEMSYTATLSDSWKASDMQVVAFISKPYSSSSAADSEVQNAAIVAVSGTSGITSPTQQSHNVAIIDGNLVVDGNAISAEIYTIDGKRMPTTGLAHGLYIVKTTQGTTVRQQKIAY